MFYIRDTIVVIDGENEWLRLLSREYSSLLGLKSKKCIDAFTIMICYVTWAALPVFDVLQMSEAARSLLKVKLDLEMALICTATFKDQEVVTSFKEIQ